MRKTENHFTPLRQALYDQFTICRYSVPVTVCTEIDISKFAAMKRAASRTAYYLQAVSRALKAHPRVNAGFVRQFPSNRSRIVHWDTVDAAVSIDRKFDGERFPFTYVIRNADRLKVKELDGIMEYATKTPVERIPEFAQYLRFVRLPRLARRALLYSMICSPERLKQRIGTFNFTNVSYWNFQSATLPVPRLLVGVTAPNREKNILPIGYSFNHVITDGAQIGEFHRDVARFFRRCEFE